MFMAFARHEQLKEDLIDALARVSDPNDPATQRRIVRSLGGSLEEFSDRELDEIGEEIGRRWHQYH